MASPKGNLTSFRADCGTGNCTFTSYAGVTHSSIGICKRCVDVSGLIYEDIEALPIQLPVYGNSTSSNITYTNSTEFVYTFWLGPISVGSWQQQENLTDLLPASNNFLNISVEDFEWAANVNGTPYQDPWFNEALQASVLNVSILTLTLDNCKAVRVTPYSGGLDNGFNITCPHSKLNPDYFAANFSSTEAFQAFDLMATSCAFYPCVKNYHGTVNNSLLTETVVNETIASFDENSPPSSFTDYLQFDLPCVIDHQMYTLDNISSVQRNQTFNTTLIRGKNVSVPDQCLYRVSGVYLNALSGFVSNTVFDNGGCTFPDTQYYGAHLNPNTWSTVGCEKWWLKSLFNQGYASVASVNSNLEAVTTAITNVIRMQGTASNGEKATVQGISYRTTICTRFDWAWLAFPMGLLVLTILLLATMAVKMICDNQNTPIWKSSILPLLFAAPWDGSTGSRHTAIVASADMDIIHEVADRAVVTLERQSDGWRFIGEDGAIASGSDQLSVASQRSRNSDRPANQETE
jgi:hypothetical protein